MTNLPNKSFDEAGCGSAADVLSYLYGELQANEIGRIESHIATCGVCAAEAEAFSALRGSLADWKREFDLIPTPPIRIEENRTALPAAGSMSVLESIRAFLAGFPMFAATSAAALLVVGFGAFYLLTLDRNNDVAETSQNRPKASPTASSSPAGKSEPVDTTASVSNVPSKAKESTTDVKPAKAAERQPKSTADKTPRNVNRSTNVSRPKNDRAQVPTLGEESGDEDDTLRLADLFDEIGSE